MSSQRSSWVSLGVLTLALGACGTNCSLDQDICQIGVETATSNSPASFSFSDLSNASLNTEVTSNAVVLTGFTIPLPFACTGCTTVSRNGSSVGTVGVALPGDSLALTLKTAAQPGAPAQATLAVGSFTAPPWRVTTVASGTPNSFGFQDVTGVNLSALVTSDTVTLTGSFTNLPVSCVGCNGISRNGAAFGVGLGAGFSAGDTIAIRVVSSSGFSTTTQATVTIGSTQSLVWRVTTLGISAGDPCNSSPVIGQVCSNGMVYAGLSTDGNVPMYTTPCDYGQTYNPSGSLCVGAPQFPDWSTVSGTFMGLNSPNTGRANTQAMHLLYSDPTGPYPAAEICRGLSFGGYTDWYLPAANEMGVIMTNAAAIGGINLSARYLTSTEITANQLLLYDTTWANKIPSGCLLRCVRRN